MRVAPQKREFELRLNLILPGARDAQRVDPLERLCGDIHGVLEQSRSRARDFTAAAH